MSRIVLHFSDIKRLLDGGTVTLGGITIEPHRLAVGYELHRKGSVRPMPADFQEARDQALFEAAEKLVASEPLPELSTYGEAERIARDIRQIEARRRRWWRFWRRS